LWDQHFLLKHHLRDEIGGGFYANPLRSLDSTASGHAARICGDIAGAVASITEDDPGVASEKPSHNALG
jgi:hypothetical protein